MTCLRTALLRCASIAGLAEHCQLTCRSSVHWLDCVYLWTVLQALLLGSFMRHSSNTPFACFTAKICTYLLYRAGHKMEAALEHFQLDVTGLTCLDAGLSTGGFTDCLLQRGAAKVYGVDVGFGQVQLLSQVTARCINADAVVSCIVHTVPVCSGIQTHSSFGRRHTKSLAVCMSNY